MDLQVSVCFLVVNFTFDLYSSSVGLTLQIC